MPDYILAVKIRLNDVESKEEAIKQLDEWMTIAEDNLNLPCNGLSIEIEVVEPKE